MKNKHPWKSDFAKRGRKAVKPRGDLEHVRKTEVEPYDRTVKVVKP